MKDNPSIVSRGNSVFIGDKHFSDADQQDFARLSGDINPMHMDEVAARRLLTGKKVVHGIHVLLWALEFWADKNTETLRNIKCDFKNPVHVGDKAVFFQEKTTSAKSVIRVYVDDLLCLKLVLTSAAEVQGEESPVEGDLPGAAYVALEKNNTAFDLVPAAQIGKKYRVSLPQTVAVIAFPSCISRLGARTFSALCSLSFFVGMVCPGLHSLFSTINIKLFPSSKNRQELYYSVDRFDERFGLFYMAVQGVIAGEITAFQRPAPVPQAPLSLLSERVLSQEFAHTQALIIGGSRGLGEYTAKLLVAGGGNVILSYSQGRADAQRVCDELNRFRPSSCKIQKYNVLEDPVETLAPDDIQSLTAVYFFATPKIYRKKSELFSKEIFDEFFSVYVLRFYAMCSYLESIRNHPVKIFLPSSVFVTEKPGDFSEYVMAKLSSELLAEEINNNYKQVSVVISRLPRLQTDQTASISSVAVASTFDTLLPLVRQVSQLPGQ